jgi:hypothetical protein
MRSGVAYRDRATECLRQAERTVDQRLKAIWTRLAEEWATYAERIEHQIGKLDQASKK